MEDNDDIEEAIARPVVASQARKARATDERPSNADRRAERIEEYLQDSLDKKNPLQANLGASAADLMHIRSKLMESIKAELDTGRVTLEEYRKEFSPAVSSLLLLDRYIVSYARLSHDLSRAESPEGGGASRRGNRGSHNESPQT